MLGTPVSVAGAQTPLARALAEYRATGRAAIIAPAHAGDFTTYPYGHGRARLRCAALKLCQIDLQPGEVLSDDPLPADLERWSVDQSVQGRSTVVLVKPLECDVSTNLVLMTDRRRYVVDLEAPPCRGTSAREDYMPGIRFWYPDEPEGGAAGAAPVLNASATNAKYRWGERRGLFGILPGVRYRWSPVQVMDDGRKTVFRFSPAARAIGLPTLYAVMEDGSREWVNTTVYPDPAGDVVTADRVAGRWVLVLRMGKSEHKLEVTNTSRGR